MDEIQMKAMLKDIESLLNDPATASRLGVEEI
jgi:hypothetical protein